MFKTIAWGHCLSVYPLHGEKHPNPTRQNGLRSIAEKASQEGKVRARCPKMPAKPKASKPRRQSHGRLRKFANASSAFARPIPSRAASWSISTPTHSSLRWYCRRRPPMPASTRRRVNCSRSPTRRTRCSSSARRSCVITSRPSGSIATRRRTSSRCRKS